MNNVYHVNATMGYNSKLMIQGCGILLIWIGVPFLKHTNIIKDNDKGQDIQLFMCSCMTENLVSSGRIGELICDKV